MPTKAHQDDFGSSLRQWRRLRKMTQEALGDRVGLSQKHISFIENGRIRPTNPTALKLIDKLDIPPREGNRLLGELGYAPAIGDPAPEWEDALPEARTYAELLIRGTLPQPASIVDRWHRMVRMNLAAALLAGITAENEDLFDNGYISYARAVFHPDGMRRNMENWEEFAHRYHNVLQRTTLADPLWRTRVYENLLAYGTIPDEWQNVSDHPEGTSGMILQFRTPGGLHLRFRNMNFLAAPPASQPAAVYPVFNAPIHLLADSETRAFMTQLVESIGVAGVHPRLHRALVSESS